MSIYCMLREYERAMRASVGEIREAVDRRLALAAEARARILGDP